ncbi:hypothetical protein [Sphingomicrobium arenosum]|uniref:hypothetical protein n=1 Tax=Sphingomicrobium arenosum TaxID=2233861 RepID=UPI00223FA332|nr:hypothetical protein [Sphingomicrobium arenosum]
MFGFGKEKRQRREAIRLIAIALDTEEDKEATSRRYLGLPPVQMSSIPTAALASQLMAGVAPWEKKYIGGRLLPNPSATGMAIEALSYGMDDLRGRPQEQELVRRALGFTLAVVAKKQSLMNDADYELFQILGRRFMQHPLNQNARAVAS